MFTTNELEQKTKGISNETARNLITEKKYTAIKNQNIPKNFHTTCSIRIDAELGGMFLWSSEMQRYYLIAKKTTETI